ncbi:MAG: DNA-3-methyladenine glycosylase 2 family protein [Paracoccaceae bacterium]
MRIIETQADVAEGAAWLRARCPRMAAALDLIGAPPLRRRAEGFASLLNAIVGQQVSTAAAAGIWARMQAAGFDDEDIVRAATDEDLRAAGLSRAKARYARALAEARLDYAGLGKTPEDVAVAMLTSVPGVGRWTAEVYLMFAVGHADVFAPGDLALREAARSLYGLPERPTIPELETMALDWRPWRGVAARILFTYYRVDKGREGAP